VSFGEAPDSTRSIEHFLGYRRVRLKRSGRKRSAGGRRSEPKDPTAATATGDAKTGTAEDMTLISFILKLLELVFVLWLANAWLTNTVKAAVREVVAELKEGQTNDRNGVVR